MAMLPIEGPGAWTRASFPDPRLWQRTLASAVIDQLARSAERLELSRATAADFDVPSFREEAAALCQELMHGRGFVVLKGFPVGPQTAVMYWGLGTLLGTPLPQNVKCDRLYSVRDEGQNIARDYGTVGVRFSKTTEGLNFHTDSAPALMGNTPDVIGLLALQVGAAGGESALVSAHSVYNVLLRERPDVLERLHRPFHFDRHAELRPGEPPTWYAPIFSAGGRVRYFRFYIPKGHEFMNQPLQDAAVEALDVLDDVMNREELQVRFAMEPGDVQLVSNTFILHSRTPFRDDPASGRVRHLLRLWLQLR